MGKRYSKITINSKPAERANKRRASRHNAKQERLDHIVRRGTAVEGKKTKDHEVSLTRTLSSRGTGRKSETWRMAPSHLASSAPFDSVALMPTICSVIRPHKVSIQSIFTCRASGGLFPLVSPVLSQDV